MRSIEMLACESRDVKFERAKNLSYRQKAEKSTGIF